MPDLVRDADAERRDLPDPGHAPVLHDRAAAYADPHAARHAQKSLPQLLLHGVLRLGRGGKQRALQLLLRRPFAVRKRLLHTSPQDGGHLPTPQPDLLDLRRVQPVQRLRRLPRQDLQHLLQQPVRPLPVQVYCRPRRDIPPP